MFFQGSGATISGSDCCYMVVFQYGSVVLFNVRDQEIDGYLKIVEMHASGSLPEMRKDGEASSKMSISIFVFKSLIVLLCAYCLLYNLSAISFA